MRILTYLFASLVLAGTLYAQPVITSITPDHGPTTGGTLVVIKGSGFETCAICSPPTPPTVFFGSTPGDTTLIDSETLETYTPAMPAGPILVNVEQWNGTTQAAQAFTFESEPLTPILLPIFSPPIQGAFGSQFVTDVWTTNRGNAPVSIEGIDVTCADSVPPGSSGTTYALPGGIGFTTHLPICSSTWPARLVWIPESAHVSMNVRVHDTSRNDQSYGTEIPIARPSDFTTASIVFPAVPADPGSRITLRIYSLSNASTRAIVKLRGDTQLFRLSAGASEYEPAYAAVTNLNEDNPGAAATVVVQSADGDPIWAFITVTNNVTQEITTITPDF